MTESIWHRENPLPGFPQLEQDLKTDVLVIGGGLVGILCARALTREGVDCTLIEADRLCSGITGNTTAKVTAQHGLIYRKLYKEFGPETAKAYWQANDLAIKKICALASEGDCDLVREDHYVYSAKSPVHLEDEWDVLDELGIPAEYCTRVDLPFPVFGAVRFPNQARIHPLKFAALAAKGLRIYENTSARAFAGNKVITDKTVITAKRIIVATHFPILNKHGGYFLKLYQNRSYVLALEDAKPVKGMYLAAEKDGFSFRQQGPYLLLGGGSHRTGSRGEGWTGVEAVARQYYPEARIVARWAAQDCMTLDGMPYIGRYGRKTPDLFAATGFNKWGMTGAMLSAMILSDLVQERQNPYAELFSPQRSLLHPQLAVNALESCMNLLTPTRPRCPHLGCALKWNPWEHSWDCPCHGSRFTENGKLLDNPATGNLNGTE